MFKSLVKNKIFRKYNNGDIFSYILGTTDIDGYRIKSLINRGEKTPSLFIYYNEELKDYYFKDFSSGMHGDAIDFLAHLKYNGNIALAIKEIEQSIIDNRIKQLPPIKHKTDFNNFVINILSNRTNTDNNKDEIYNNIIKLDTCYPDYLINKVKISPQIYDKFGVICVLEDKQETYYYADMDGVLVQRYRPYSNKEFGKFKTLINISKRLPFGLLHIGLQQLKYIRNVIITSSIKDMLALYTMMANGNLSVYDNKDTIVITGLNERILDLDVISSYICKYSNCKNNIRYIVAYDNDDKGKKITDKFIEEYKNKYDMEDISDIYMPYKDPSDYSMNIT